MWSEEVGMVFPTRAKIGNSSYQGTGNYGEVGFGMDPLEGPPTLSPNSLLQTHMENVSSMKVGILF